jgi:hypothetical protein
MEVGVLRRVEENPGTSVCEEMQLLKVSVFSLSGEFSMNNHFTHSTSSKCKPSLLLSIMQGWCFANGFSQNAL